MTESTYSEGDRIEAVKDTTLVRGELYRDLRHTDPSLRVAGIGFSVAALIEEGFTLTVIEKAAPKNVLPEAAGFYVGDYDKSPSGKILIELLGTGEWVDNTDSRYLDVEWVQKLGNLTRLEPVPVTAAKVIAAAVEYVRAIAPGRTVDEVGASLRKEFGVDQ